MGKPVAFLSHQTKDKSIVRTAGERLADQGVEPILDEWSFQPGRSLQSEIERSIQRSTCFILFWSKWAASSKYVQFEDEIALARRIKDDRYLTHVVLLDATPLPERHSFLLYHDWRRGKPRSKLFEEHMRVLARAILGLPLRDPPKGRPALSTASRAATDAVADATRKLRSRNRQLREDGLNTLVEQGAIHELIRFLGHSRVEVREAAARGTVQLKVIEALPYLVEGLRSLNKTGRAVIPGSEQLVGVYGPDAVAILLSKIPEQVDYSEEWRWSSALKKTIDETTAPAVLEKCSPARIWLLRTCIESGVQLRREDLEPALRRCLTETSPSDKYLGIARTLAATALSQATWVQTLVAEWVMERCKKRGGLFRFYDVYLAETALDMGAITPKNLSDIAGTVADAKLREDLLAVIQKRRA